LQAPEFITLLDRLVEREELVFGNTMGVDIDLDEIKFLARNVWRAKSAFSETVDPSAEKGLTRTLAKLHFTRWAKSREAHCLFAMLLDEKGMVSNNWFSPGGKRELDVEES